MILASRGWGPDTFARATPEFLGAAHWALYAEKVGPILVHWREIQALPTKDAPPELLHDKLRAGELVTELEALLYPEDERG